MVKHLCGVVAEKLGQFLSVPSFVLALAGIRWLVMQIKAHEIDGLFPLYGLVGK